MNLVAREIYGNKKGGNANTIIGGMAPTIGTKELLATKLSIATSNITYFAIVGLNIEATINVNYNVPPSAFFNNKLITFYNDIEGKVQNINSNGFDGCSNLNNINFPNLKRLEHGCFNYCTSLAMALEFNSLTFLSTWVFQNVPITSFTAPNISAIGDNAFISCAQLTTVSTPFITSIGGGSFQNCLKLASINFPNVTSIGTNGLRNCPLLIGTLIFNSLTTLGSFAFYNNKMTGFTAPELLSAGANAFAYSGFLNSVIAPKLVTIGDNAFDNCTAITSINFPLVQTIGQGAFNYCTSLGGNYTFNSLTSLGGGYNFQDTKITGFTSPNLTNIKAGSFQRCSLLVSVAVPLATIVEVNAFANCSKLASINFPNITSIGTSAFANCVLLNVDIIFNQLLSVGANAFSNSAIKSFTAPNVTSFGNYALLSCGSLTFINCPNVVTLGDGVFSNDFVLGGNIVFNSLTSMATGYQFADTAITSFSALNVAKIPVGAFRNCTQINSIDIRNAVNLGDTVTGADNVFESIKTGCIITANIALQTNNGGLPDSDLQYAITSRGATVNYI